MGDFVCEFLEDSAQDLTNNMLVLSLNVVIAIYNLAQLKRSTFSKLAGRKAYVLLLLLPLFHASLSPLIFLKLYEIVVLVVKPILCCLNVMGLRAYIKVVKLASGGVHEIQESLELITYTNGYIQMGCSIISCYGFGSLWFLFVFLNRTTSLLFLQPIFMMCDTILTELHDERFFELSYIFLGLDILVTVVAVLAMFKMTRILGPLSKLPRTCVKMFYVSLVILLTQVQFSTIFTIIHLEKCNFRRSIRGLLFLTSVEMIVVGFLGSVSFPLSDLLLIRVEAVKPPPVSLEQDNIIFVY